MTTTANETTSVGEALKLDPVARIPESAAKAAAAPSPEKKRTRAPLCAGILSIIIGTISLAGAALIVTEFDRQIPPVLAVIGLAQGALMITTGIYAIRRRRWAFYVLLPVAFLILISGVISYFVAGASAGLGVGLSALLISASLGSLAEC